MSISIQDVDYLADLARISFDEKEKEEILSELNAMIFHIEKIKDLNIENKNVDVNPIYIQNKFREDVVRDSNTFESLKSISPQIKDEYVVVPSVLKK